jgi:hypothetical protein
MADEGEVGGSPYERSPKLPDKKATTDKFIAHRKEGEAKTAVRKEEKARETKRGEEARMQAEREEQERQRRQEEAARRRTIQQVLVDARSLDFVIDEYGVTADPGLQQDLLQQGLSASIHGLDIVGGEPFMQDPREVTSRAWKRRMDGMPQPPSKRFVTTPRRSRSSLLTRAGCWQISVFRRTPSLERAAHWPT